MHFKQHRDIKEENMMDCFRAGIMNDSGRRNA